MLRKLALALSLLSAYAWATVYYVAANGSDSQDGTEKAHTTGVTGPWLHAPGMSTCTGTCASTTINAGDSIILRGGDTWHAGNSGLSPFIGFVTNAWHFTSSGSSSSCNLNTSAGAIVTTSCIYIGVDQTWFSGSSWARPQINMDNPLSTSSPASCSFEDSAKTFINVSGNYVIIDNLEVLGYCWNVTAPFNSVTNISANDEMRNFYFHGWTMGTTATGCGSCDSDEYWATNSPNVIGTWSRIDHCVFDGSDSTYGNLPVASGNATEGVFLGGGEADHNVLNHVSNGVKFTRMWWFHDNFIENMSEPVVTGTHGNVDEMPGTGVNWTNSTYYYNNFIRQTNEGETIDMYPGTAASGLHAYIFNNVMTGANGNPSNCYMIEGDGTGGPGTTEYFNNTADNPCQIRSLRGSSTGIFQNNHFIGYSPSGTIADFSQMTSNTDNGNELWQSEATANGQGYTSTNNYAPTSAGNPTVGAGVNLSSICSGMDNSAAATACASGIGGVTYNTTNNTAVDNTPIARGVAWDIGAYECAGSSCNGIVPPTVSGSLGNGAKISNGASVQ